MDPIRIFLIDEPGGQAPYSERMLTALGLADPGAISAIEGVTGRWHEVYLKGLQFGLEQEAIRQASRWMDTPVEGPDGTEKIVKRWLVDQALLPQKRIALMVERWTFEQPATEAGFLALSPPVAICVHEEIVARLYPSAGIDSPFSKFLSSRQPSSAPLAPPAAGPDGESSTIP